jgi:hypothetical protein
MTVGFDDVLSLLLFLQLEVTTSDRKNKNLSICQSIFCMYIKSLISDEEVIENSTQRLRIGDGGAFEKRQPNICTNAR